MTSPSHTRIPGSGLSTTAKVILGVAAVVFLACSSAGTNSSGGGSNGAPAASAGAAAAGPGATKDSPAPVGTEVTPAKGWTVKVTAPATDATAEIVRANQFNKPAVPTSKLYAVPVTVSNGSGKPGAAFTEVKLGALPPSGVKVEPKFAVAGYPVLDVMSQLQPGAVLAGNMVFELDPSTLAATVLLAEPQLTLDQNEDQRFLAIQ